MGQHPTQDQQADAINPQSILAHAVVTSQERNANENPFPPARTRNNTSAELSKAEFAVSLEGIQKGVESMGNEMRCTARINLRYRGENC